MSALGLQKLYLESSKKHYYGRDHVTNLVIDYWSDTLNKLETDPLSLANRVDWIVKKNLIDFNSEFVFRSDLYFKNFHNFNHIFSLICLSFFKDKIGYKLEYGVLKFKSFKDLTLL